MSCFCVFNCNTEQSQNCRTRPEMVDKMCWSGGGTKQLVENDVAEIMFADAVCLDRPSVTITDYEVHNWQTFWFRWAYNGTPGDNSSYDGWFRNRYDIHDTAI